ncbi:MAG: thiamine diphosphokinase [Clostridia bacterium]|nr:thiamine diphosphokinase [Clostridia bacterium]
MGICYIVGAGVFEVPFSPKKDDLVIAADGGFAHLQRHGIRCDLLLGDFDSIDSLPKDVERMTYPVEKDFTDTALALYEGERRGYKDFVILGGTGGREDHTFANYCLLSEAIERGIRAKIVSKNNTAFMIKDEKALVKCDTGCHFSAFAFGGTAHGVSIRGLYYEAENIDLSPSCHLTVSNIFKESAAEVSVREGALLVIVESHTAEIEFA